MTFLDLYARYAVPHMARAQRAHDQRLELERSRRRALLTFPLGRSPQAPPYMVYPARQRRDEQAA
jgi:hypothetical protein